MSNTPGTMKRLADIKEGSKEYETILSIAQDAAYVAASIMGVDLDYSLILINDSSYVEDGLCDSTGGGTIMINLARLKPFPEETNIGSESLRLMTKIYYVVYHEMRHIYQEQALRVYQINAMMGENVLKPFESSKKCEAWLRGAENYLNEASTENALENDAEDFANYMLCRYPLSYVKTHRSGTTMGALKRKYNKIPIPPDCRYPDAEKE